MLFARRLFLKSSRPMIFINGRRKSQIGNVSGKFFTFREMETAIKLEGLTRRFGDLTAVDDMSLDIFRNEIFGLLGPNGAGKTTTISMICGLLPPSAGTIAFGGQRGVDRRAEIGYCPQENIFYPKLTCREQLIFIGQMYGLAAPKLKARAGELLDQFGLKEKTNVRAASLSGGMKRRLNICLALIHDPEILVLDEPEAGLDPQSRIMVRDFIKSFRPRRDHGSRQAADGRHAPQPEKDHRRRRYPGNRHRKRERGSDNAIYRPIGENISQRERNRQRGADQARKHPGTIRGDKDPRRNKRTDHFRIQIAGEYP